MSTCATCGRTLPSGPALGQCPSCGAPVALPAGGTGDRWRDSERPAADATGPQTTVPQATGLPPARPRKQYNSVTEDIIKTLMDVGAVRRESLAPEGSPAQPTGQRSEPRTEPPPMQPTGQTNENPAAPRSEHAVFDLSEPTAITSSPVRNPFDRVTDTKDFSRSARPASNRGGMPLTFAMAPREMREEIPLDAIDTAREDGESDPLGNIARALERLCRLAETAHHGRQCVVDLLTLVASADGEIDEAETEALGRALGVLLGGEPLPEVVQLLIQSSLDSIRERGRHERIAEIAEALIDSEAVEDGLTVAVAVAYASYGFSRPERETIDALARLTGTSAERVVEIVATVRREVDPG